MSRRCHRLHRGSLREVRIFLSIIAAGTIICFTQNSTSACPTSVCVRVCNCLSTRRYVLFCCCAPFPSYLRTLIHALLQQDTPSRTLLFHLRLSLYLVFLSLCTLSTYTEAVQHDHTPIAQRPPVWTRAQQTLTTVQWTCPTNEIRFLTRR